MLYTLTLNPSLDYIMDCPDFSPGKTNRSAVEYMRFGGKGLNASAVLSSLGVPSVALTLLGGETGTMLKRLLDEAALSSYVIPIDEPTRINVKLLTDKTTEINARGPFIGNRAWGELLSFFDKLGKEDTLLIAGSIPASLSDGHYEEMLSRLSFLGVRIVIDGAGEMLRRAAPFKPYLVKPNRDELSAAVGTELKTRDDIEKGARRLQSLGAQNVLVSLGGDGALLLSEDGMLRHQSAPKGEARNTVGAGDTMLAAFLSVSHSDNAYALRYAVAAGCATVFSGKLATREAIDILLEKM